MCEFCKKHAGNKSKWYFNPKNYSKEMGDARKEFLEKIAGRYFEEWIISGSETMERSKDVPVLNKLILNLEEKYMNKTHGGQIIPLEDAVKVLELCENPAILPCVCRQMAGKQKYCCLNFGLIPELYKKANQDEYMEEISVTKAKKLMYKWEDEGLYHLIMWYKAPYIASICNCANPYCTGYKGRQVLGLKTTMIKGEYIAKVNEKLCKGCKTCMTRCQFGAISFNIDEEKAFINIRKCFGCGLCVTECENNAVELIERRLTPAKNLW